MIRCAVVGASGYAGAETTTILASHPETEIVSLQADGNAGRAWGSLYPGRRHLCAAVLEPFDLDRLAGLDVVFLARPHGAGASAAALLRGRVGTVIDLSGDMRLADADAYRTWYGLDHPAPHLLGRAAYGLPELFGRDLPGADLIACAGCYATVAQLAAAPAFRLGDAVRPEITVAAQSGTSGAGRKAEIDLSFSEVHGNLRAYRVGRHAHQPEIAAGLARHARRAVAVTFVPHLVPIARGILASVVVPLTRLVPQDDVLRAYQDAYEGRPFVRVVDSRVRLPEVRDVVGTNFCDLSPVVDDAGRSLVIVGVIDNLVKGAAGQAVQVMNIACGLPETAGLLAGVPMEEAAHV